MNYDKSTYKAFSLNAEDLKEVVELATSVSELDVNHFDTNQYPKISITFFNGIKKDYQDVETVLQLKNTSDNPIIAISVFSPFIKNMLIFSFSSSGIYYRLECVEEEKFYFYKIKAEEIISSLYENKLYSFIFSSGAIYILLYLLIQALSSIILSNIIELNTIHELLISISIVVVYFFSIWLFMFRKRRLFPIAFFQ